MNSSRYLLTLVLFITSTALANAITVGDLRCNYSVNPLGIADFTPSLSWKLISELRGDQQSAYQLVVGTSPNLPESSYLWNTGKVSSSQSVHIRYAGNALRYGQRYFWKVKVWDATGNESSFSETGFWEMTIDPLQWKAEWISAPVIFDLQKLNSHRYAMIRGEKHDYLEPMPLLRKQFNVSKKILRARISIAAPGFHELYINGRKVSPDVLSPAFTNYDKTVLYNVHDVTSFLASGANTVGVMLGNGWYNSASKEVWGFDTAPWRNHPALKFQLDIVYDDNMTETIISDTSWKAARGPVAFSQVRQGEYYDARLEVNGWSEAGADESRWVSVRRVGGPIGVLRPENLPPVRVMKNFPAVSSKKLGNGNVLYDFGQNIAGFISVKVTGKAGTRLQFKYAERLDKSGALDQSNISNLLADSLFQVDRYTLKGTGEESWSPRFVYHGFRYAEFSFTGAAPEIKEISASAVHTSFEHESDFSCSDETINKIQQSTLWSYRNNFVGFPTDCPQREKNGWTGDAQLACETGLSNFNTVTSYQKWLTDLRDEQQPNGSLPGIVPTSGWGYYWGNGPAWDIACIVIPWSVFRYTGDTRVLEDNYAMMKKYVDYMASRSPGQITEFGLGDWIPVETETPVGVTSTGYFYYGATILSKAAALLGKKKDQDAYSLLATSISAAFNKKYFNSKESTYANSSQTALSCALFHGLVPEKSKAAVNRKLEAAIHARQDHIDCGILGARYIFHALSENNNSELAFKMIASRTYPGWGYWIDQGATTLWEDWRGESSLNHIMLGDVSSWFYKTIAGIRPDDTAPGFKHFTIYPEVIGGLTWANGKYESVYGTIVSNWKIENSRFIHTIEVPPNTTATYYPPASGARYVSEGGIALTTSVFKTEAKKNGRIGLILESGKYQFSMPLEKK